MLLLAQEHGAEAMQVILNDLPTNNWARCVANFITGDGAPAKADNYIVSLAPKSFYSALVWPAPYVPLLIPCFPSWGTSA